MIEIKKIEDYYSLQFNTIFTQYFKEIGIELKQNSTVFDDITKSAKEEKMETLALFENNVIIGFLMFQTETFMSSSTFFEEKTGFIREFFVTKENRKKGYGSFLFSKVESLLKENNVHKLILTTDTAFEFYKKYGFIVDSSYNAKNKDAVLTKLI